MSLIRKTVMLQIMYFKDYSSQLEQMKKKNNRDNLNCKDLNKFMIKQAFWDTLR